MELNTNPIRGDRRLCCVILLGEPRNYDVLPPHIDILQQFLHQAGEQPFLNFHR